MPQLDLFTYTTSVGSFCLFFISLFCVCYLLFLGLSCRVILSRLFFSASDLFQYIGGVGYVQGYVFFLLSREYTLYKFSSFVSQRM